jgi:hypothetical protein
MARAKSHRVDDDVPPAAIPDTRPPAAPARGDRIVYTNRLGVGPWTGVIEDAHVEFAGVACCWLRVTKPNGNEFFTAAPLGDGPDTFALVD